MTRRIVIGILIVLLLAAGAVGVGVMAYRAGVVQGMVTSGQVITAPDGGRGPDVFVYPGGPFMYRGHWGFGGGFGFLGCLFPILFFFLLFGLFRLIVGPRRWGWGGGYRGWGGPGGPGGPGWGSAEHPVPPMFEEWHRRAHGEAAPPPPPPQPGQ